MTDSRIVRFLALAGLVAWLCGGLLQVAREVISPVGFSLTPGPQKASVGRYGADIGMDIEAAVRLSAPKGVSSGMTALAFREDQEMVENEVILQLLTRDYPKMPALLRPETPVPDFVYQVVVAPGASIDTTGLVVADTLWGYTLYRHGAR